MSKESSTTQTNDPPSWAKPLFEQSASEANKLYSSGAGGNTWLGSTVAPLSDTTMTGVNQLAQAGQSWDTAGTRPLYQQLGASAVSPSYSETNLSKIASGQDNPYFEEALQGQLDKTAAQVRSTMSGMGRTGSGAETAALTDSLGNIRSNALYNQWNQNIQNQLAASGQMDSSRMAGLNTGLSATNAMAGLDQQNFQNQLAGAQATLDAGGIVDKQAQSQLSDDVAKFYALDNQDWTRLGMLQSAASGAAGPYGTQVATSRQPMNIGGLFSGLGSLMGKSDLRLKENMVLLGEMNGIPIVEFSYRGMPERWRGTVAQGVPLAFGDAVVMEPDGFYAVDYGRLGFLMEMVQ